MVGTKKRAGVVLEALDSVRIIKASTAWDKLCRFAFWRCYFGGDPGMKYEIFPLKSQREVEPTEWLRRMAERGACIEDILQFDSKCIKYSLQV